MNLNAASLAPEIFVSVMACVVLVLNLYIPHRYAFGLTVATLLITAVILVAGADVTATAAMNGMYAGRFARDGLKGLYRTGECGRLYLLTRVPGRAKY